MKLIRFFIHFFFSSSFLSCCLSFALVFSAIAKCLPIYYFEITLIEQGLVSSRNAAFFLTRLIIGVELWLGVAILLNGYRKCASLLCSCMLCIFSLHLLIQMKQGVVMDCGCFGKRFPTSPEVALIKNFVLLMLSVLIYIRSQNKVMKSLLWAMPMMWVILFGFLGKNFKSSPSLEFFIERPIPSIHFESSDKILLTFLDVDCEHCFTMGLELSKYATLNPKIQIGIYFLGDLDGVKKFFRDIGHSFPHRILRPEDFYALVEEIPPVVVYIQNGDVVAKDTFLKTIPFLRPSF